MIPLQGASHSYVSPYYPDFMPAPAPADYPVPLPTPLIVTGKHFVTGKQFPRHDSLAHIVTGKQGSQSRSVSQCFPARYRDWETVSQSR